MPKKTPRSFRQASPESLLLNPLIPTEVFIELNPELVQFYEKEYAPAMSPAYYGQTYQNWQCYPRRFCMPRPCTPV
jgi:hypothetical protein